MKNLLRLLILLILTTSCNESSKSQIEKDIAVQAPSKLETQTDFNKTESKSKQFKIENSTQFDCQCFDGIGSAKGDTPIIKSEMSNGKSIVTCGFLDKEMQESGLIISEFNIFNCETGKPLVEYGAVQICRIEESPDRILIEELKYFPAGIDWKWELLQIGEQVISLENGAIVVSQLIPKFKVIEIDIQLQDQFLSSIEQANGIGENWEDELGKLEFLSLNGNSKAWQILKNYEEYKGVKTDGALAEQWKDAIANVDG